MGKLEVYVELTRVFFFGLSQDDDSDSDAECALSEYWSFQRESRRWSRNRDVCQETPPDSGSYFPNYD